ncbi:TrkH family potassium uptake protein [Aurantimonas sp. VKM B-3413]|uniref:TrkH family potassium uptake protein n=1 Tax=Aurantimonas sp. VKM B-3413 TaxID=2779401 RepID=UPI001E3E3712|nr:potassium transporter TrkG [Aurantimonas sp. VKM B-3413]
MIRLVKKLRGLRFLLPWRTQTAQVPRRSGRSARLLLAGYVLYMTVAWILLSLPFAHRTAVGAVDDLFTAVSAVSTTGLMTIGVSDSYTVFGQIVIALSMQLGGIGYMTVSSFAVLALHHGLGKTRSEGARTAFSLPDTIEPKLFIQSVVLFTLCCETVGALALYPMFSAAGVEEPGWSAIFHAISAFCTAGLSLNADSFEAFRGDFGVNSVLSILCILGALGFIVVVDVVRRLTGSQSKAGFASQVIVRVSLALLAVGTLFLFATDPGLATLQPAERLMAAFFQTMAATSTSGFDTFPASGLSRATMTVLIFLMVVGAAPASTGGGIKVTSFTALVALVRSVQRARGRVRFFGQEMPVAQLQIATATLTSYLAVLGAGLVLLFLVQPGADFEPVVFEAVSALSTVGLSLGLTPELTTHSKLIVIVLMAAGRVGALTFALATSFPSREAVEDDDNALAL